MFKALFAELKKRAETLAVLAVMMSIKLIALLGACTTTCLKWLC